MTTITRSSAPAQTRTPGWTVVVVQGGYAALYLVCGFVALAHAGWQVPVVDDSTAAAPAWFLPVGGILMLGPVLAGLGLFLSAMLFLLGYTQGNRRLTVALLTSTAVTALLLGVSLTPAAQSVAGWLLD
ncbi:hypothetical protein [Actinoplanes sp. NPDC026619]|uniref:hypothetical protein n=1 Tax=Actinoplanes sp. NPDC026619 TaxID=3155798 RepID=UPI0033D51240